MPLIKTTFIFEQGDQGWSESYYSVKTSPDPTQHIADATAVGGARIALSGAETRLTYYRISNVDVPRTVFLYYITPVVFGIQTRTSDSANVTLPLSFKDATRSKSKISFIRGIWDDVVGDGGAFKPTPGYTTNMNIFLAALRARGFGWLGISLRFKAELVALVQNANGTVSGTTIVDNFPPQIIGTTKQVRLAGLQTPGNLNGQNPCFIVDARNFTTIKRIAILPWTGGGTATAYGRIVYPIDTMVPGQIGERKAGRIFGAARGRAPARKRA